MLKLHGAAALAGLIIYGSLLPIHIRRAWTTRRNIFLGISLVVLMLLLTISGYAAAAARRSSTPVAICVVLAERLMRFICAAAPAPCK